LPESFGNLSSLEGINFSYGKPIHLPASFGRLRSLKYLEIKLVGEEIISKLPTKKDRQKGYFGKEKFVDLGKEEFIHFPESFGNLSALEEIEICGNIGTLPESFGNLRSLKKLSLHFSFTMEKYYKGQLRSWHDVYIANNFNTLPSSLYNLDFLEEIIIDNGNLIALSDSLNNLYTIESIETEEKYYNTRITKLNT
jgi:Leucine-rich repeat (LRR) protein